MRALRDFVLVFGTIGLGLWGLIALIGGIDPGEATGMTIVVAILFVLWLLAILSRYRDHKELSRGSAAEHERLGF